MITIENLSIGFGDKQLFDNANFKIQSDDRFALVGANGTGKTTLLKIIYGLEQPDSGKVTKQKGISIGYLPQEFYDFENENTLFNEVKNSLVDVKELELREGNINRKLNSGNLSEDEKKKLIDELGEIHHQKEHSDFYAIDSKIEKILAGLGFKQSEFSKSVSEFSGGWKMRIHLAKILIAKHDLIMLDEPTNHLDLYSLQWLVSFLQNYKGALLIVSHDRYFIEKVCNKTIEISNGKIKTFNGSFAKYLEYKEQREKELLALKKNREKRIKEIERFIERFRYKASKAKQVQSRIKMLEKLDEIEIEEENKTIDVRFKTPPRLPEIPVTVNSVTKYYGDLLVFENISFKIERNDKVAFVGLNGAGKSTLAKILAGKLDYNSGTVEINPMVKIGFFSQETADNLDLNKDVLDTLMEVAGDYNVSQIRSILGAFLFSGDDVFKKTEILSGGEKARLALAKLLLTKANLLILDEPTNHLDFSSKKILQKALMNFEGSVILISHDIDFMRPFINKVFAFENKGLKEFYGGIDYFLSKYDFLQQENSNQTFKKETQTRKEKKRIEAELRQKKYKATKDLKAKIELLENKISELENDVEFYSNELTKEEVYSNPEKMKLTQQKYKQLKLDLDNAINEWTELSEELEKIEQEFENV